MAETPSKMVPLGFKAPDFELFDTVQNRVISLQALKSAYATVIMFICNHCPYVKIIKNKLNEVARHYQAKEVSFIAISSNDAIQYPEDGPDKMREDAMRQGYVFPYLYDETQEVAKAYQATCTPDFFIFDKELNLVYRGRFDDATPGNGKPTTGQDLTEAIERVLTNQPINLDQKPSLGCNIKWK